MTFLRCSNILLFFIITIVLVNPSVAQDSLIILNSSDVPTILQKISQLENTGGTITHRLPPNITMEDIRSGRLNNLSRNMNIVERSTKPVNATYRNTSTNIDQLPREYSSSTLTTTPVHNINKSTNYTTIQEAIDNASSGDEIHVDSGTYYENVNVTKQLTLRGIGMPVVNAGGSGSAITLAADGISLEGFTATQGYIGIEVASNNNTLSGNNASNNGDGIFLFVSSNNTLSGNNASNNNIGTSLYVSSNNMLSGNNASNCLNGIYLGSSNNNTIRGNNASDNIIGISLYVSSYNNMLIDNDAYNNIIGISLYVLSNYNILRGNDVLNNNEGIDLYDSSNNTLSSNNISNSNDSGILLKSSSNNNSIYNNIFNNTIDVQFYGSNINKWNTTKESSANIIGGSYLGGNFWANPSGKGFSQTCLDNDTDGLCDLKYSLNDNNSDDLPLKYKSAPGITVVSPNGRENWTRGTTQTINGIQAAVQESYVKIELLKPGVSNK